jgi:hypothetical protein
VAETEAKEKKNRPCLVIFLLAPQVADHKPMRRGLTRVRRYLLKNALLSCSGESPSKIMLTWNQHEVLRESGIASSMTGILHDCKLQFAGIPRDAGGTQK